MNFLPRWYNRIEASMFVKGAERIAQDVARWKREGVAGWVGGLSEGRVIEDGATCFPSSIMSNPSAAGAEDSAGVVDEDRDDAEGAGRDSSFLRMRLRRSWMRCDTLRIDS